MLQRAENAEVTFLAARFSSGKPASTSPIGYSSFLLKRQRDILSASVTRTIVLLLAAMALALPLAAQSGMVMKGAVFFAGRQGRWTLLTAWTILFDTEENYDLAMDAAQKAEKIAESNGDDARTATSLRYLAVLYESKGKYAEAEAAVQRALALRQKILGADDPAVADLLVELARLDCKLNKQFQAEPLLVDAERIREKAFGKENASVADVLLERASVLSTERRYADAEPLYRLAIAVKRKVLGADDPDVADAVHSLAASYFDQARYAEAESLYKTALQIDEKFTGPDDPIVIPDLTNLAAVYEKLQENGKASEARQRAAHIQSEATGSLSGTEEHKQWIQLVKQSFTQFNAAEFSNETPIAQRAMRYSEAKFGPQDYRVAAFLVILATQYYQGQAAFKKAEPLMARALRIQEKTFGTEDASLSETLFSFGNLYVNERKNHEAESAYGRAVGIQQRVMNIRVAEDPFMHSSRSGLANVYRIQGRYGDAEKLFRDGLEAEGKATGPEPPRAYAMASLLTGLADIYRDEGKVDDAVPLLQRAIGCWDKAWGTGWEFYKHKTIALGESSLAAAYIQQHRYSDSEDAYERAIKLAGWRTDEDDTEMRWNLAQAYRLDHKFAKAEEILQRELDFDRQNNLNWHLDNTSKAIAGLYIDQDRYADAEKMVEQSLQIEQATMDPESPYLASTLYKLGEISFALARPQQADVFFQRSFAILEHQLQYYFSYMSEEDRLRVLSTVSYRFPVYFSFVERFHADSPQLTAQMYDLLLWQKGLVVRSIESLRQRVAASGDSEALALLDDLTARRTRLSNLMNSDAVVSEAARKNLAQLKAEANEVEQKLVARSQVFAEDQKGQAASWQKIRQALQASGADAAVEFVQFPFFDQKKWADTPHYAAIVITSHSDAPTFVELGDAAKLEGEPVRQYKEWIARPEAGVSGTVLQGSTSAVSPSAFFDAFWKPLDPALGPAKRVYVAPDGILNQVSFAVIPSADGRLLSDRYELRMVNSTVDLLRSAPQSRTTTAVLIGNPKFNLPEDELQRNLAELNRPVLKTALPKSEGPKTDDPRTDDAKADPVILASAGAPDRSWTTQRSHGLTRSAPDGDCAKLDVLPALPGTQAEVQGIYSMLQSNRWSANPPYTDSHALEEVVKRVHHPRVLHIATHGFFLADQTAQASPRDLTATAMEDPMLSSGLFFAGATSSVCGLTPATGADDGILTAYEASMLDLQGTELVVLSACNTGLGTNRSGEGVFGLRRAFQEAGAESVLISMWQVPDEETKRLMTLFYENWLAGKNKHEALRIAQWQLRNELKTEGRDSPFYWGAFVLVGP
jgi:CHAT domain-containing protein/tetratricopeptide (TPR) repeat protein